jgi:thioredoxin:protein disulfide reductase
MDQAVNDSNGKNARNLWRWLARLAILAVACVQPTAHAADLLDPEAAFQFSVAIADNPRTIVARFHVAEGYYLYRDGFAFTASDGVQLGRPQYPSSSTKFDETYAKEVPIYRGDGVIRVPIQSGKGAFVLTARLQGCADQGVCYPPEQRSTKLELGEGSGAVSPPAADASPATPPTSSGRIDATLRSRSLLAVLPIFFVLGLLLSVTPCVLPMLPILSSVIVGQSAVPREGVHRAPRKLRGFALALAYSLGVAIVYTSIGIAAGLAGEGFAGALQQPWVLFLFAALLVGLALSMFGLYQLQLPAALQTRLAEASGRIGSGRFAGVFAIGAISALIVGPCVAAPLAGVLLYISQTHDVVIGGVALFAIAAGMSVPLLLVGAGAGSILPRAGRWMQSVERSFGILLIAVALWTVSPAIPVSVQMLGWAALAIVGAAFLRVFDTLDDRASGWLRLRKGVGVVLLILGAIEIVGAASGGHDLLQPLESFAARSGVARNESATWMPIESTEQLDAALASAVGKPVLLDFYADWCISCKEMDRFTFADPRVSSALSGFQLLRVDVTANNERDRALLKRFHLFGPPGAIFFDGHGREVDDARVIGFESSSRFLMSVARVANSGKPRVLASMSDQRGP